MTDNDNMKLWDAVCETDPKHTKPVTIGSWSFTSIDPMQQIKKATEHMGVAGRGWGWTVEETKFLPTDQVALRIRLWYGSVESFVEQWGQCGMYKDNAKTKPDNDCVKKATTDGITKCLTYFGFNADIFMGLYDDNKYVMAMDDKFREVDWTRKFEQIKEKLPTVASLDALKKYWNSENGQLNHMKNEDPDKYNELVKLKDSLKKAFDDAPAAEELTDQEKLETGAY